MDLPRATDELKAATTALRSLVSGLLGSDAAVDDVVQQTWLTALRTRPPSGSWLSWLRGIARNEARGLRRTRSRRHQRERAAARSVHDPREPPDLIVERVEAAEIVLAELRQLREPYRTALTLRYFEDLEPQAIASRLDVPTVTVKSRLKRGLSILRDRLDRRTHRSLRALVAPLLRNQRPLETLAASKSLIAAGVIAMKLKIASAAFLLILLSLWLWERPPEAGEIQPLRSPTVITVKGPEAELLPDVVPVASTSFTSRPAHGKPPAPFTNRSARLPRLIGRTIDMQGQPIFGVHVRTVLLTQDFANGAEVTSREDGGFSLELPVLPFAIHAGRKGYAPLTLDPHELGHERGRTTDVLHDIVLVKGTSVTGRVVSAETREPLEGASVVFRSLIDPRRRASTAQLPVDEGAFAQTDANGVFRIDNLPATGFHPFFNRPLPEGLIGRIIATCPGHAEGSVRLGPREDGSVIDVVIECWPTAILEGRVVAAGQPQPSIQVGAVDQDLKWSASVRSDAEGRFIIDVPAGAAEPRVVIIIASWPGAEGVPSTTARTTLEVSVRAGERRTLQDLVLPSLPAVHVRVLDCEGKPLEGALVRNNAKGQRRDLRTDNEGRATALWPASQDASPCSVMVMAPGHAPIILEDLLPNASPRPPVREARLQRGRSIAGRVVDTTGAPIGGVTVGILEGMLSPPGVLPPDGSMPERDGADPRIVFLGRTLFLQASMSAPDGSFIFQDLPEGTCHVAASSWSPEGPRWIWQTVDTVAAEVVLRIDRGPAPRLGAIQAHVRDEAGHALATFTANLRGLPTVRIVRPTLGELRVDDIPEGRWTLDVTAQGRLPITREVTIGEGSWTHDFDLVLERGLTVSGRAVAEPGISLHDLSLALDAPGERRRSGAISAGGSFQIGGLSPGRWIPRVVYPNMGSWDRALAVQADRPLTLTANQDLSDVYIHVVHAVWINLRIPAIPESRPGDRGRLIVEGPGGAIFWVSKVSLSRAMTVKLALPAGFHSARLLRDDRLVAQASFDVRAGSKAKEISLSPTAR